jgi:hypothetical protein
MSLEFTVASDVQRDTMNLECCCPDKNLWLNVEENAEGESTVEGWFAPEETTFSVEEVVMIVAQTLKFAGHRVRAPGQYSDPMKRPLKFLLALLPFLLASSAAKRRREAAKRER